jgi:ferredoxin
MKLRINHIEVETEGDLSIVQAARKAGVEIPVMCHKEGYPHFTSCMICMVQEKASGKMLPACSSRALEGMEIETHNDEIRAFRKATLELLLSDHLGDCEAPCQRLCPVHHEVPKMIREIMAHDLEAAIATVRRDMAIPALLERYCNAPCEKGCRRAKHDEGLSIRELTRFVADWDLQRERPYIPPRKSDSGRRFAVIGAGPTGLSAAYHLALEGHKVVLFEKLEQAGGRIQTAFRKELLHDKVMEGELRVLSGLGIELRMKTEIGPVLPIEALRLVFSAVLFAGGATDIPGLQSLGLPLTAGGLKVHPETGMTELPGVFAGGSVLKPSQPLVKSVAAGKTMACLATQYAEGKPMTGLPEIYNHNMGRLLEGELEIFVSGAGPIPRLKPENLELRGFNPAEARTESTRCLHCDCRKNHDCKLRRYSDEYGAEQGTFKGEDRARFSQVNQHPRAIYEPGKCIKCGLCVRITKQEGEPFGFTFIGRGFEVKPGVSLNKSLAQGLERVAENVVASCPTGALAPPG